VQATVVFAEYWPALHIVQVVAPLITLPVPTPTSVIDPTAQVAHAAVEAALNRPARQGVQDDAPDEASVFVTEPGAQAEHAAVEAALNRPARQGVQDDAPDEASVFVTEPGAAHVMQEDCAGLP
jgi:ubiquitin